MKYLKYIILFLSLLFFSVPALGYNCTTLTANDSTDNTAALNTCLTNADADDDICNIPTASGSYFKLSSSVTIPANVSIVGASGARFNTTNPLILSNASKVINIDFKGCARAIISPNDPAVLVTGAHIRDCGFGSASWASILLYLVNDSVIDNNTFTSTSAYSNLQILGGKRNIITNNTMVGGKTCIIFKYDRSNNGGGFPSFFDDNVVMDNSCTGVDYDEEAITFDSNPSAAAYSPFLDYDTASIDAVGAVVTLTDVIWDGADDRDGYYLIVMTGASAGEYRKIVSRVDEAFTVASAFTDVDAGDGIAIGAVFTGNVIAFNYVRGYFSTDSILFYGSAFHNRIENNDVRGIQIKSMDRYYDSDITVTNTGGRGPCGYNLIKDNVTTKNINVRYRCGNDEGSYGAYNSYGNTIIDNTIGTTLDINYQYYYVSGNSKAATTSNGVDSGCSTTTPYATVISLPASIDISEQSCTDYGLQCLPAETTIALVSDLNDTCPGDQVCSGANGLDDVSVNSVSPGDGETDVVVSKIATWASAFTNDDVFLKKASCPASCDTLVSNDDADNQYDMSTLDIESTYCLGFKADGGSGDCQEFEFTTSGGPPQPGDTSAGLTSPDGLRILSDTNGWCQK